ncbi:type II toxin-antitoxin system HipA family toxin [Niveispirillum sp. KHB5.9]|uniref:type II toxin-antitoxin system HipA family toxin n=1 Tax=Niveispirillum sp. KHB5.9 TaxID=3400269 RepID=UPI003A87284A
MRLLEPGTALVVTLDFGDGDILPVGRMAFDRGRALFEADTAYLAAGIDASAGSYPPMRGTARAQTDYFGGLHGVFADSLPDSWGRLLLDRSAGRLGLSVSAITALDRLACVGKVGIGALTYQPATTPEGPEPGSIDLPTLAEDALRILDGGETASLRVLQRIGGSPGGARPKVLVGLDGKGGLTHGEGELPAGYTHWMVKFRSREDFADIGPVEAAYMEMASLAGLYVPASRLIPAPEGPGFFAVRRFDRDGMRRLHVQSLCAILEAPPGPTSIGYRQFLQATKQVTGDATEMGEAFRRAAFNVLAHNRDDHSKQHAFAMDRSGRWRLTPAYDLTFAAGPGGEHQMDIAGEARQPGRTDLLRLATSTGIAKGEAQTAIEQVLEAVGQWQKIASAFGVSAQTCATVSSGLEKVRKRFRQG